MMVSNLRPLSILVIFIIWLLLGYSLSYADQADVECLKEIRSSLKDPKGYLASWDFTNTSEGFICRFIGIECWHPDENRVLNIELGNMELKGTFPLGVAKCSSMTGLNLSSNKIYGGIPNNISKITRYITSLDLSKNDLSGEIPSDVANLTYLNILKLDYNQLTGQIPPQIGSLGRLKEFSVSNNRLSGPVPIFSNARIPAESYANNSGLCGGPLRACRGSSKKTATGPIV